MVLPDDSVTSLCHVIAETLDVKAPTSVIRFASVGLIVWIEAILCWKKKGGVTHSGACGKLCQDKTYYYARDATV
jgi:hypothetical protein